jgi:phosphoketolase
MAGSKQPSAVFLSSGRVDLEVRVDRIRTRPDVVLVGIGSELSVEVVAAVHLLKRVPRGVGE